jgi:hypothetical protein
MCWFDFTITDVNHQTGRGRMNLEDTRYKSQSREQVQELFDNETLVLDDHYSPSVRLQDTVYEVTPRPTTSDVSQLPVGTYNITDVQGSLPVFTKLVTVTIL